MPDKELKSLYKEVTQIKQKAPKHERKMGKKNSQKKRVKDACVKMFRLTSNQGLCTER